ncbi:CorA metal ion transporter [Paecilomyces lecythidis]
MDDRYLTASTGGSSGGVAGGPTSIDAPATSSSTRPDAGDSHPAKKKKHRNRHRRRRPRRQSFLTAEDVHPSVGTTTSAGGAPTSGSTAAAAGSVDSATGRTMADETPASNGRSLLYHLGPRSNLSGTSLESEALLDHRDQPMMRPRRDSRLTTQSMRPESWKNPFLSTDTPRRSQRSGQSYHATVVSDDESDDGQQAVDDRTPLIRPSSTHTPSFGRYGTDQRRAPSRSTVSSRRSGPSPGADRDYDVNNPPSIPGTPKLGPDMGYDDALTMGAEFDFGSARSQEARKDSGGRDAIINVDGEGDRSKKSGDSSPPSPKQLPPEALRRRRTITLPAEEDVCFPTEVISELAEEEFAQRSGRAEVRRRRRRREWPDLEVLEEWSREEKEERNGDLRVKKISEPVLVGGRLRPQYAGWRREEDEMPYRFTYFNEDFQSTIHAQTISELVQPGGSFRELFIPEPPLLEDDSSSDEEEDAFSVTENVPGNYTATGGRSSLAPSTNGAMGQRDNHNLSVISEAAVTDSSTTNNNNNSNNVSSGHSPLRGLLSRDKPKRYGPRPTWWLDVLCPTDAEMRVIAKAFGIHALTAEDIMMQEAREKVELFRNYYFLNYRTFEQDSQNENYLQPVNMYVVVFRDGILTFHFSQTPHPANVRRRIRQLRDYLLLSSDWISYALIDDITDVFGPLIQTIEDEVDNIDDTIMQMHSAPNKDKDSKSDDKESSAIPPGDMLRQVGECRKKVMGMYRLLSNKADVIKGFAKRCNEQWEVAPKSEIGLYLGDIQDHIMTMTSNLAHYETLLSRAHSNYLAQINILMNERQEQTADVLGKLTVLGTIVLPMNIICGMWGMNVKVPGQDIDNLYWFWSITAGLFVFAFVSFLIAKRVYGIV